MSSNRFYTVMIVPEKTSQVRKLVVPAWMFKGLAIGIAFTTLLATIMIFDYWYVMNQISENKQLKMENRRLKQQVQVFQNKMTTIESTMERVKTFATRLKVITNIEDRGGLLQSLNSGDAKLPDAASNIGNSPGGNSSGGNNPSGSTPGSDAPSANVANSASTSGAQLIGSNTTTTESALFGPPPVSATQPADASANSSSNGESSDATNPSLTQNTLQSPDELRLRQEYDLLDTRFSELNHSTLYVEQLLQDQYELLADQKAFLAALPTRKPAVGYFTSGFGVRKSPIGGRVKMHEGLDIANRPGTPIKAPADAVVLFADSKAGYGQTVILDHGYGLETWFGHTRKILVNRGQKVRRGDTIALLGNSGRSTGPHVHYEVRVHGTPVDPLSYILEN